MPSCPDCDGKGANVALVCFRAGSRVRRLPCSLCGGTGEVTPERLAAVERGRKLRDDRVARRLSQREEAERLGITPQELSRLEHGRGPLGEESE